MIYLLLLLFVLYIRIGGGEFAFVVLTLADKLDVLPDKLAKMLVGVVVLSMALTPYLSLLGDKIAEYIESIEKEENIKEATKLFGKLSVYIILVYI